MIDSHLHRNFIDLKKCAASKKRSLGHFSCDFVMTLSWEGCSAWHYNHGSATLLCRRIVCANFYTSIDYSGWLFVLRQIWLRQKNFNYNEFAKILTGLWQFSDRCIFVQFFFFFFPKNNPQFLVDIHASRVIRILERCSTNLSSRYTRVFSSLICPSMKFLHKQTAVIFRDKCYRIYRSWFHRIFEGKESVVIHQNKRAKINNYCICSFSGINLQKWSSLDVGNSRITFWSGRNINLAGNSNFHWWPWKI